MNNQQLKIQEKENTANKNLFAMGYRGKAKPINLDKFSKSAKLHVEKILESKAKSTLDIGCGSGSILLALQKSGVDDLFGIELTPQAIELATKRFESYGKINKVKFMEGDIVDLDPPFVESTSLHKVVCCYSSPEGMIEKTVKKKPKVLVITLPRYRLLTKVSTFFENAFLKIFSIFKPSIRGSKSYLHKTSLVDDLLMKNGYEKTFSNKEMFWETNEYQLKEV
jgi:SAM-dependent methyltransferase